MPPAARREPAPRTARPTTVARPGTPARVRPGTTTRVRPGTVATAVLVLAPAAVLPGGLDRFVLVKTLVVAAAVAIGLGAPRTGRLPRWASVGLAVGGGWLIVAAVASGAPWAQLWGRWPRYEGLVVLPAYAGALWLGARVLGSGAGRSGARALVRSVTVLTALVGVVAVVEAFGGRPLASSASRPGSLLGNATEQGAVGVLCAAVLLAAVVSAVGGLSTVRDAAPGTAPRPTAARYPDHPVTVACALALAVVTVVLSGSRGALLGLVAAVTAVGGLALVARPRAPRAARAVGLLAGGTLAATVALALVVPATAARLRGTAPLASGTVEGRRLLWQETAALVADRPVLGVGPSGFVEALPAFHTTTWAVEVGPANPPDSPHTWPLQLAAAGGLPLLVLGLVLAGLGVAAVIRSLRAARADGADGGARVLVLVAALGGLVGYAVVAATHFTSAGTTPLAAFLAGAAVARAAGPSPAGAPGARDAARVRGVVAVVTVTAWSLVLVPAVASEWTLAAAYRALGAGDLETADATFAQAQSLRPWDADVAVLAAHAFAATALQGVPDAGPPAGAWASDALDRVPTSATALAAASAAAEVDGRWAEADALMSRLVDTDPTNAEWRLRRGVVRATAGRYDDAERDFLRATALAPGSAGPWLNLAALYEVTGDPAAAEAARAEADEHTE